ncbi:MAG TPA: hypothetical protein VN132_14340 [Bdellovibrio sp.]|nr:hypothetical protein [Bdellovibrio sp.]
MRYEFLLLILLTLFSQGIHAQISAEQAHTCAFLEEWRNLKAIPLSELAAQENRTEAIANWQQQVFAAKTRAANQSFELYMSGRLPTKAFTNCLSDEKEKSDFMEAAADIFFNRSLKILETSNVKSAILLAKNVRKKISSGSLVTFKISSHLGSLGPSSTPNPAVPTAGYHRERHSIYASIDLIPPNEWLINFCHELAHFLDGERFAYANAIYNEEKTHHHFLRLAAQFSDPETLTSADQTRFDDFMMSALDRGVLGEYRAWAVTLLIYKEGVIRNTSDRGLWHPISWAEDWFAQQRPGESIPQLSMRYLDPSFTDPDPNDPDAEEFQTELFQRELHIMRDRVRTQLAPLYDLSIFF